MPDPVREFWAHLSPDRLDRAVTGLGRKPALVRAAALAAPLLARDTATAADFGCGTGQLSLHAGTPRILGVERAAVLAVRAATRMDHVAIAELRQLSFPAEAFDVGFLLFVLDDYPDKGPIVSEALRTLKPGSTLVLAAYSPRDQHMGYLGSNAPVRPQPGTLRVWLEDIPGLRRLLRQHGCCVTHGERISSGYRVNANEFAERVARRQGVCLGVARDLVRDAGITDWVRREFLVLSGVKR